jgi:uncharacterized protein (DUF983 family)
MFKGTKLHTIFTGSCPVCQHESMYKENNPYKISKLFDMHTKCSHCGTKYKIEPSFFYGAMYVSYPVGIAFATAAFVISFLFFGASLLTSFFIILATLVVFLPVIVRISRNIWVSFFFKIDPEKVKR